MAEAAVLFGGYVKRITGFTDTGFNHKSGFLVKFTSKGITFVHVNSINFRSEDQANINATAGYYDENKFLKYKAKEILLEELPKYRLDKESIENGIIGDIINVRKLKVVEPFTDFCEVYDISWVYASAEILDVESNIIIPPPPVSTIITTSIPVHEVSRGFYQHNIPLVANPNIPSDKRSAAAYILTKIALQINNIQKDIFPLFENDAVFTTYINSQNIEWRTADIFFNPYIGELQIYLDRITEFYNSLYTNQIALVNAKSIEKLYWLTYILSKEALFIVAAYDKVRVLDIVAKGTILGETSKFILGAVNEEELVIKIIQSTANGQEDDLLNGLINLRYPNGKKDNTLFQLLYDKINDSGIGAENLKTLMDDLHKIWLKSSFFPYNIDGTVKDSLVNPEIYASKPMYIGYESGTILWAFNTTNYDFTFNSGKIVVVEPTDQITENGIISNDVVIGSYGIYQTVTIKSTDSNTNNTRFLSVNVDSNQQAALPIFYLKYIDDKKRTDNLVTQLELTFDLIITATGIGNLGKLRHIRSISRLGRVALGLEVALPGDILVSYKLAQGVAGTIEVTGSLASIFINYSQNYKNRYCEVSSPTYDLEKCKFYTRLDNIFLVMQMFSGVLDFVTSRQLQKASQDLLSGPVPNDLNPDALIILQKFAGDLSQIKDLFRVRLIQRYGENSPIWIKLNSLDYAKQGDFLDDFGRSSDSVLDKLNADNGKLVDRWVEVEYNELAKARREVSFLENYRFITEAHELTEEVFIGRKGKMLKEGAIPPYDFNDYTWQAKGVHHKDALDPSKNGIGKIVEGTIKPIGPSGNGYYMAKVQVYNSEFPQNGGWKVKNSKRGESTFFPDSWDKKRVQQEMTLAFINKKPDIANQYLGIMSDGVRLRFYIENGVIKSAHPNF